MRSLRLAVRLGLRLAITGGRDGVVRLVFMAAGVAIGIALLLLTLSAPAAAGGRAERIAWQDAAYAAVVSAETGDYPDPESVDGALFLAVSDYYDGRPMLRAYVAALGDDAPVPPGLDRLPRPGEVAVSPAMLRLLESTPDDQLDDRFPGRVALIIGPDGLAHDNELVGIIGRAPEQLRGVRSVAQVYGFSDVTPTGWAIYSLQQAALTAGAVLVLAPAAILVVIVTRVAWRQREQRLAAIRLVGASRAQITITAAAENAVGALLGVGLGWALYEGVRRILAATIIFQYGHFWLEDLAVGPSLLAAVLVGTPLLVVLTTLVSLRHVHARPLAVSRRAPRRAPSVWRLAPVLLGLGGQFALVLVPDQISPAPDGSPGPLAGLGSLFSLLSVVGVVLAGPWLVMVIGKGIARISRGVPSLLAARRIASDPYATFRGVAAVGLAAAALAYLGSAVPTAGPPPGSGAVRLSPGVVHVMTGGVNGSIVAPLVTAGMVSSNDVGPVVNDLYIETDGSLAAENRIRTIAANLVPNAIINTDRDPVDYGLETFFTDFDRLGRIAGLFVLIIGAFGLTASMIAGLVERRRPMALMRAAGVRVGELRRSLFLETAATMLATSVVGVAVGLVLAYVASRQSNLDWRWPGIDLLALIGSGVLAALAFSTLALPLLERTTRHDAVRFE
jgi:FtsX-like permease family